MNWLEFHPERFQEPGIIVSIVIMLLGIILLFTAKPIGNMDAVMKLENKGDKPRRDLIENIVRILGVILAIVGAIIALI